MGGTEKTGGETDALKKGERQTGSRAGCLKKGGYMLLMLHVSAVFKGKIFKTLGLDNPLETMLICFEKVYFIIISSTI